MAKKTEEQRLEVMQLPTGELQEFLNGWGCTSVVEHLFSMCKVMFHSQHRKRRKERRNKKRINFS
jgi:hypothetical protein